MNGPKIFYTGRDKATFTNHLNFVSVRHYCQGFAVPHPVLTASLIIMGRAAPLASRVDCESHTDAWVIHFCIYLCLKWYIRAKLSQCMSLQVSTSQRCSLDWDLVTAVVKICHRHSPSYYSKWWWICRLKRLHTVFLLFVSAVSSAFKTRLNQRVIGVVCWIQVLHTGSHSTV